ncbi:hypothetical protein HUJ04_006718 [Dendroctonus ponderosae]|nr:hypothetical protein HUJ04_006718 [Dendroctonus ponderosae]
MSAEMRSPNVSVTPINMEYMSPNQLMNGGQELVAATSTVISTVGGVVKSGEVTEPPRTRSAPHPGAVLANGVADIDGPDAELARIELQSVNMRSKTNKQEELPRPMSWEGELSDGEREGMCIDESSEPPHLPENLSVSASKQGVNFDLKDSPVLRLKQPPAGSYSLHSTPSNSPLLNQRHPGTGVPIISHKDFMQKALNVPPTPSPDSAVHSAYSVFSSPNQSPLTQRHVTLTPNLSRNNSDASHSSCCSYSSVSVSVSPTQQFSPTHSPIQGRHIQTSLHSSPLHHGILYRSLPEDTPSIQSHYEPKYEHDPGGGVDENDDKSGLLHTALPAQPGISRCKNGVAKVQSITLYISTLVDTSELREAEKVRVSQEKALKALQDYTLSHYPESPSKFGELLLRIPELQRTCQVGKEMLTIKKEGEGPSFNLLMELLRGDH